MTAPLKIVLFAAALVLAFAAGMGMGATVGPVDRPIEPDTHLHESVDP